MRADTKVCSTCGRSFAWRRAWRSDWEAVRYCSDGCRRHRPGRLDGELERVILRLVATRHPFTICPSEAARAVGGDDWRPLMERTRRAARRLAAAGDIEITQEGRAVDPSRARGPIRLRRTRGHGRHGGGG